LPTHCSRLELPKAAHVNFTMKNRTSIDPTTPTAPVCWQRESATACLRIELESGEIHLLPYNHLTTARLTLGIQDFAIKWIRAVPEKYGAVVPNR
jgi:hypothetical protein